MKFATVIFSAATLLSVVPANTQELNLQTILERVAKTQATLRDLQSRIDDETNDFRQWSEENAVKKKVTWSMRIAEIDTGFFNHDLVAENTGQEDIEIRCRISADTYDDIKKHFSVGDQVSCTGTIGTIYPRTNGTEIILQNADAYHTGGSKSQRPTDQTANVRISVSTKHVSESQAREAIEIFKRACRPLFTHHADDITEINATVHDGSSTRAGMFGWGAEIHLQVHLKDRTRTFSPEARANGHVLWYFIGGGDNPGFQAAKRISQIACGLSVQDDNSNQFVPTPELAEFLPPISNSSPMRALLQRNGSPEDHEKKAMQGDYQAQRNTAWCYHTGCHGLQAMDIARACAWRIIIMLSGSPEINSGDASNFQYECGLADKEGRFSEAEDIARDLYRKIYKKRLPSVKTLVSRHNLLR